MRYQILGGTPFFPKIEKCKMVSGTILGGGIKSLKKAEM
jgi:hypothetical protein